MKLLSLVTVTGLHAASIQSEVEPPPSHEEYALYSRYLVHEANWTVMATIAARYQQWWCSHHHHHHHYHHHDHQGGDRQLALRQRVQHQRRAAWSLVLGGSLHLLHAPGALLHRPAGGDPGQGEEDEHRMICAGLPGEHLRVAGPDWLLRGAGVGLAVAAVRARHPHRQHCHARGTISINTVHNAQATQ